MRKPSMYDLHLDKNAANHVPLSPLSFLERSALRSKKLRGDKGT